MTIRTRLLTLLLPAMIVFVSLVSLFFYLNWSNEIMSSFRANLKTIVVSSAQSLDPQKISWIDQHLEDPNIENNDLYQRYYQKLDRLKESLPITNIYIVRVDPVKKGETVILDAPASDLNKIYDGFDKSNAYRLVYLLDASKRHRPGDHAAESYANKIYQTREPIVTTIHESQSNQDRVMSAYAPIINSNGDIIAVAGADLNLKLIDRKLKDAIGIIFFGAVSTILLVIICVYFIANRISQPVQKLKNAALAIAAGDYVGNLEVRGPHELSELANTLNTMSDCLQENMSRIRESSLVRERMHGEYECSLLLQHYMLEKVIEDFHSNLIDLRNIKSNSSTKLYGLQLKVNTSTDDEVDFSIVETEQIGFKGMFNLLNGHHPSSLDVRLSEKGKCLDFTASGMPNPIVWNIQKEDFSISGRELNSGDLIFVCNQGFAKLFKSHAEVMDWFRKVLKHFATEDLDLFMTMLRNELNFLAKKHHIDHEMHILCIRCR